MTPLVASGSSLVTGHASLPSLITHQPPLATGHLSLPLWFAAYTCAHHEKRVAEQLANRDVEYFLPLYNSVRRWKDRRVKLQLPLFPGYVFVHIDLRDRLRVLEIPSIARLVGFDGHPAALPETEIDALRKGLDSGVIAVPHPYLTVGRHVRVKAGPLEGLQGIVVRRKNTLRLIISLDLIQRSVQLEIDALSLEPVTARG